MKLESVAARRVPTPVVADRPSWGWPPEGVEQEGKLRRTLYAPDYKGPHFFGR